MGILFATFASISPSMENDYYEITQLPWSDDSQNIIDREWQNWTIPQKENVLRRMEAKGLLSAEEVLHWPMHQVPRKSRGG